MVTARLKTMFSPLFWSHQFRSRNRRYSDKIVRMSVKEIERAIAQLPKNELSELMKWLENHHHEVWVQQIENDLDSGRLDELLAEAEAEAEYNAGEARPL